MRRPRAAYDTVLAQYDLLAMPTVPTVATPVPPAADPPIPEIIQRAFQVPPNTAGFDRTTTRR